MSACLHCGSVFSCRNANSHEEGFSSKGLRDNIFVCWCLKWAPVVLRVLRKKIFTGRVVSQALKWGSAGVIIPGSVLNMYGCGPWGRGGLGRVKLLVWLDGLRGLFQSYCSSLLFYFIFFFFSTSAPLWCLMTEAELMLSVRAENITYALDCRAFSLRSKAPYQGHVDLERAGISVWLWNST